MPQKLSRVNSFLLTEDLENELVQMAQKYNFTKSDLIRVGVKMAIARFKKVEMSDLDGV